MDGKQNNDLILSIVSGDAEVFKRWIFGSHVDWAERSQARISPMLLSLMRKDSMARGFPAFDSAPLCFACTFRFGVAECSGGDRRTCLT